MEHHSSWKDQTLQVRPIPHPPQPLLTFKWLPYLWHQQFLHLWRILLSLCKMLRLCLILNKILPLLQSMYSHHRFFCLLSQPNIHTQIHICHTPHTCIHTYKHRHAHKHTSAKITTSSMGPGLEGTLTGLTLFSWQDWAEPSSARTPNLSLVLIRNHSHLFSSPSLSGYFLLTLFCQFLSFKWWHFLEFNYGPISLLFLYLISWRIRISS